MSQPIARPLALGERYPALDVLRGFALLGILIMNLPGFAESFWLDADGSTKWQAWWDTGTVALTDTLFSGKFNALFTLLFALGLTLQIDRLDGDAAPMRRRLAWLLVFGLVHALLIWHGDVLHMYALMGVALLLLRRAPDRLIVGLFVLTLLWSPARSLWRYYHWDPAQMQAWVTLWLAELQAENLSFGAGSWWDTVRQRAHAMVFFYTHASTRLGWIGAYISLFSTALVGLWLARRDWLTRPERSATRLWRLAWGALALGLCMGLYYALLSPGVKPTDPPSLFKASLGISYTLSRLCVMLFYALALAQLAVHPRHGAWLRPLATVGRMPLSQYIFQSLLCTFIFQGWGLAQWGRWGQAALLALALAIYFAIQVPLAAWWLARYRYGPLEYLWRLLSYGAAAVGPLRRAPALVKPVAGA